MTTAINPFPPIVAFGIDAEKTLDATPSEGSTVMELPNSSDIIAVGDPVWVRSFDETVVQYRGLATASSTTQITCQIPLQDAVSANATAWKPTNFVRFFGEIQDTQRPRRLQGTTTVQTMSGRPYNFQAADPQDIIDLALWDRNTSANATLFREFLDFLDTDRSGATLPFNLGYYDFTLRRGETPKVLISAGNFDATVVNNFTNSTRQSFFIIDRTDYVES